MEVPPLHRAPTESPLPVSPNPTTPTPILADFPERSRDKVCPRTFETLRVFFPTLPTIAPLQHPASKADPTTSNSFLETTHSMELTASAAQSQRAPSPLSLLFYQPSGQKDRRKKTIRSSLPFSCQIKRGPMIRGTSNHRQSSRHIHRFIEIK